MTRLNPFSSMLLSVVFALAATQAARAQGSLLDQLRRQQQQTPAPPSPAGQQRPGTPTGSPRPGPEARVKNPYGPELLGIRLGMTMAQAEAAIRSAMTVSRVLDTPDPPTERSGTLTPFLQQRLNLTLRLRGRLFMTADGNDQIAVFQGREADLDRVVAVWRKSSAGESQSEALAPFVVRYGPVASQTADGRMFWGGPARRDGVCESGEAVSGWPVWQGGGKLVRLYKEGGDSPVVAGVLRLNNPSGSAACDAALSTEYDRSAQTYKRSPSVVTRLYDRSVLAWITTRPAVDTTPTPGERLMAGPYGPDMLGIRLGMTMDQAEALIRVHMPVVRVLEAGPPPVTADLLQPYLRARLFVSGDDSEYILLVDAPAYAPGRVVRAVRGLRMQAGWEQILAGLTEKYGQPDRSDAGTYTNAAWDWQNAETSCDLNRAERMDTGWTHWQEGGQDLPAGGPQRNILSVVKSAVKPPDGWSYQRTDYSICGPVIRTDFSYGQLTGWLVDQRITVWLLAQPKPAAPQAAPVPGIKF